MARFVRFVFRKRRPAAGFDLFPFSQHLMVVGILETGRLEVAQRPRPGIHKTTVVSLRLRVAGKCAARVRSRPVRPGQAMILVVHHDPWVRAVLSDLVDSAGWTAKQASNGASGLRLAVLLQPQVIVVGPELSELRSGDLIDLLHADTRTRRIPVVAHGWIAQPGRVRYVRSQAGAGSQRYPFDFQ